MNANVAEPQQKILHLMEHIDRALALEPANARILLHRAQCLLALGRSRDACEAAAAAQRGAPTEPALLDAVGTLFSQANDPRRALDAYTQAITLAPNQPHFLFNRAAVRRYLGELTEAERDYDRVIALKPDDYEAHRNRTELRTQTPEDNHTSALEALLAKRTAAWAGEVDLRYALAKEYEDLGQYATSFQQLERGSRLRRDHLRYDVTNDVATVDWIIEAFPGTTSSEANDPAGGTSISAAGMAASADPTTAAMSTSAAQPAVTRDPTIAPIFIVGLPRSGSTLLDRILSSHSAVTSAGELPHFAQAIVDSVRRQTGGSQLHRKELVARSAHADFAALGRDYLARARAGRIEAKRFTDKMPLNYLYCGLIQRALPNARIVHVSRRPMAACYAIYKTLFKDGYPFSYDLAELAQYYAAYRRLMRHWETTLPGSIHGVNYESLVADQNRETRLLLEFCGLEWENSCAEFHRNPAPSTTASAVQVRRPIYDTSVTQWRNYERQLAPLRAHLTAAGVDCDE
jgi:tetratricopeptide (TPR) repeat protein